MRIAFEGDIWASAGAFDRERDGLPLGGAAPDLVFVSFDRSAVIPPAHNHLQAGALIGNKAQAQGRGKPTAAGVGLIEGVVGVVFLLFFLQAIGGVVAGFFPSEIGERELLILCGAAGLLLEDMGHKEARGVAHRWWLVDLFMPPGHVIPIGTDQIDAKGIDQVLADLGGGSHSSAALAGLFFEGANRAEHTWQSVLTDQQHLLSV